VGAFASVVRASRSALRSASLIRSPIANPSLA
jgi:hypothetical protein